MQKKPKKSTKKDNKCLTIYVISYIINLLGGFEMKDYITKTLENIMSKKWFLK